jgi:putative ABC transport system permease protein
MLKLIWKGKWRNILLSLQVFIAFLVFALLLGGVLENVISFIKPLGYNYENIWNIKCYPLKQENPEVWKSMIKGIDQVLNNWQVSKSSGAMPYTSYSGSTSGKSEFTHKSVTYSQYNVDVAFARLMHLEVVRGRWFEEGDYNLSDEPIVITSRFKEEYFGEKEVQMGSFVNGKRIIGIIGAYRKIGELTEERAAYFQLVPREGFYVDYLLKVPEGSGYQKETEIVNGIRQVAPGWEVKIVPLSDLRKAYLREKLMPYYIIGGISIIALINVLFGLFGILWYSISRRRIEIGLRRAVGAGKKNIQMQFVLEMLLVAIAGIVPGSIIAIQFKLFSLMEISDQAYWLSVCMTSVMIMSLVVVCAFIPGRQAAKVQPAVALAEE